VTDRDIVIFGVQGSGKGTQAKLIAEKFRFKIFETGAELRKITNEDSPLGRLVKGIVDKGNLVPNEIVIEIVAHFLDCIGSDDRVIFDGLPRSMVQKESFDALLQKKQRKTLCLFLDIPREKTIQRLLARNRTDDNEAAIKNRLENYDRQTLPVIEKYEAEGKMIRVNGDQGVNEVFEDIIATLEKQK